MFIIIVFKLHYMWQGKMENTVVTITIKTNRAYLLQYLSYIVFWYLWNVYIVYIVREHGILFTLVKHSIIACRKLFHLSNHNIHIKDYFEAINNMLWLPRTHLKVILLEGQSWHAVSTDIPIFLKSCFWVLYNLHPPKGVIHYKSFN